MNKKITFDDIIKKFNLLLEESMNMIIFVRDIELQKVQGDIAAQRKTMVSTGDRSAKIKTYNYPQGRVTDHRVNKSMYNLDAYMNGDLQEMIDAVIMAENAEKMKGEEENY